MLTIDVWQEIDRVEFHENAILLDVRVRSQDYPIKHNVYDDHQVESQDGLTQQLLRDVLDDFALVLSGRGGPDHVSAVCMECDEERRVITLRISSNDGVNQQTLDQLNRLLRLISDPLDMGIEQRHEDTLAIILQQCFVPFLNHASKFSNELRQSECPSDTNLRFPSFSTQGSMTESPTDTEHLGSYSPDSFDAYMQLSCDRLRQLRRMCTELGNSRKLSNISDMMLLAKAAHEVRRSGSFYLLLHHNIRMSRKPSAVNSMLESLKERLGKLSRYWRAAKILTAFGALVLTQNTTIDILPLPSGRHEIPAMSKRTLK
ncbi:hypothetical protein LTR84_003806 [Exophiala bonariae]|uniref:Uncharacterized protein n=1 Tax=Exophiala bonariae TaxID=1690606 RepID=A0AAV9N9T1_9EURO|nr:hypothetical protein LTR84_003806 [Exophiala bonariae]